MAIGTRSILFGAHQFLLHPLFLAWAWWKLYGVPWDPRLWLAFVLHDLGYLGKPNMDGPEGETHPEFAARLMGRLFGDDWADFCRYHSRHNAKRDGVPYSRLCVADKLVIALEPWWLYLPRVWATGELAEYLREAREAQPESMFKQMGFGRAGTARQWFRDLQGYIRAWVAEHREGKPDTWTGCSATGSGTGVRP